MQNRLGILLLLALSLNNIDRSYLTSVEPTSKLTDEIKTPEKKEVTEFEARFEYAKLLSNLQRYDEALIQFKKLLIEKPNSTEVKIEIAHIYYYQKNYPEALTILEALPAKQLDSKALLLVADIHLAQKDYTKAEEIYRKHLSQASDDDLTKFKLAEVLSWQKKYEESVSYYREILSKHPDDIQLRRKYAMVLMWMGEDSEAAAELEKTLK